MPGAPAGRHVKMADRDRIGWNDGAAGAARPTRRDIDVDVGDTRSPNSPGLYVESMLAGRTADRRIDRLAIDNRRVGAAVKRVAHCGHIPRAATGCPCRELERGRNLFATVRIVYRHTRHDRRCDED